MLLGRDVAEEGHLFADSNLTNAGIAAPKEARGRFCDDMEFAFVVFVVSAGSSCLAASKRSPGTVVTALDDGDGTESRVEMSTIDLGIDGEFWTEIKHEECGQQISPCDHAKVGLLVVVLVVGGPARLSVASGRGSEVWAPAFFLYVSVSDSFR